MARALFRDGRLRRLWITGRPHMPSFAFCVTRPGGRLAERESPGANKKRQQKSRAEMSTRLVVVNSGLPKRAFAHGQNQTGPTITQPRERQLWGRWL